MCYDINNILNIQHAINCLKAVNYYDYGDNDTHSILAQDITNILDHLDRLLENAKKYERECYCVMNDIDCKTCKHNGCQSSKWICEMCDIEMLCGNWEKDV